MDLEVHSKYWRDEVMWHELRPMNATPTWQLKCSLYSIAMQICITEGLGGGSSTVWSAVCMLNVQSLKAEGPPDVRCKHAMLERHAVS